MNIVGEFAWEWKGNVDVVVSMFRSLADATSILWRMARACHRAVPVRSGQRYGVLGVINFDFEPEDNR